MINRQIGSYTIVAPLGAGAMGEVYRARDSKLGRDVAIKILPAHLTADPERRSRFAREARLLAALNHPHIGAIYGLEEVDGITALVLELVEGPTLADRLARGPLAIPEALAIARQVAEALDEAHEKGIVHRDLKPANIVLQGADAAIGNVRAKVLDFGLAKTVAAGRGHDPTHPTGSFDGTAAGRILGTPAYMSPEQARGQAVDKRTDIWAFGCVLYEMLAGRPPFEGDTMSDTFVSILEREPDWTALPARTPASIRRLLERCLRKDPRNRLHDVADALIEIDDGATPAASGGVVSADPRAGFRKKREGLAWIAGIVAVAVVATIAVRFTRAPDAPLRSRPVTALEGEESDPALSSDGSQIAFIWKGALHVKPVDSGEPRRIADDVFGAAWSPDGQWIATYRGTDQPGHHTLLLVSPGGGSERPIASFFVYSFKSIDWSPDGEFIALTHKERPDLQPAVFLVSLRTGARTRLSTPPRDANFDADPHFSNDGRRIAYFRNYTGATGDGRFEVMTVDMDGSSARTVGSYVGLPLGVDWTPDDRALILAMQTPDSVAGLLRVSLNDGSLKALEVGENAWHFSIAGHRLAYAQRVMNSALWWAPGPGASERQPPRLILEDARDNPGPTFSRDGRRLAYVSRRMRVSQVWNCASDGSGCVRVTHEGICVAPAWSPGGESIAFVDASGNNDIHVVDAGGGVPRALTNDLAPDANPSFSHDGRFVYFSSKRDGSWRLWRVPSAGGRAEAVTAPGLNGRARVSRDGWLYLSRLAGSIERMRPDGSQYEIVVGNFPGAIGWTLWQESIPPIRKGNAIFRVDPATREQTLFHRFVASAESDCGAFDVSPDGRSVVYCQGKLQGDIIVVDNLR